VGVALLYAEPVGWSRESSVQRYSLRIAVVVVAAALVVASVLLWLGRQSRFPVFEPGLYAGTITGIFPEEGEVAAPFIIRADGVGDLLLVSLFNQEPSSRALEGVRNQSEPESLMPLTFESPFGTLRFTGAKGEDSSYAGAVTNVDKGGTGRWRVQAVQENDESPPATQERIKLWLKLKEELGVAEQEFSELQRKLPEQREEAEKLSAALSEGSRLKSNAEERFSIVKGGLDKAQAELKERQDRAKKLEEKLLLAQRVTSAGRLVALVQQTAEQEARWVESMLRVGGEATSPEVESALEKGSKVLELQEQIEQEKARIHALTTREQAP